MKSEDHILVVEDNADDVYFARRALRNAAPHVTVAFVHDGQAALEYLRGVGPFADRSVHPLPAMMFLDLKLPYIHGLDVLAAIRADPMLKGLPVVVLTSSEEERDRNRAQALGIQDYVVNPAKSVVLRGLIAAHSRGPTP